MLRRQILSVLANKPGGLRFEPLLHDLVVGGFAPIRRAEVQAELAAMQEEGLVIHPDHKYQAANGAKSQQGVG